MKNDQLLRRLLDKCGTVPAAAFICADRENAISLAAAFAGLARRKFPDVSRHDLVVQCGATRVSFVPMGKERLLGDNFNLAPDKYAKDEAIL